CSATAKHEFVVRSGKVRDFIDLGELIAGSWQVLGIGCHLPFSAMGYSICDGSDRHRHNFRQSVFPVHFFSHAMSTVLRFDHWLVKKICQVIDMLICTQDHVTAAAAVAAIWPAFWHEL